MLPVAVLSHPIVASLSDDARRRVGQQARVDTLARHQIVALRGAVWPWLLIIAEGELQAVKESFDGRSLVALTLGKGEAFWGPAFFLDDEPLPILLRASQPTRLCLWHREALRPILQQQAPALWEICRIMLRRMAQAGDVVEGLAFQPVMGRLAALLLDRFGEAGAGPVARDLTLEEMAGLVGSTREMVCRSLYRLADEDKIRINRTELTLIDRAGLEHLAGKA